MLYIFITILIIGIILLVLAISEPHVLEINSYHMPAPSNPGSYNNDGEFKKINNDSFTTSSAIKILFISDLHVEYCFIKPEEVIRTINNTRPDVVIFGGDICNNLKHISRGISYLKTIKNACDELNIPFLGVTGNHDVGIIDEDLNACGFTNLNNSYVVIKNIAISGVSDSGRENRIWPELQSISPSEASTHILIAHNPDYVLNMPNKANGLPVEYVLTGHIHGGQIRTPFNIEFDILRKDILPKRRVYHGVHIREDLTLFISRGLGCILLPFRLMAKPEISIIEIPTKKDCSN